MESESNIDVKSNVELATEPVGSGTEVVTKPVGNGTEIVPETEPSEKDLLKLNGWVLFTQRPIFYDVRTVGYDGNGFFGTKEQWQEYINELACACCKKLVTDCKCQTPGKYLKGPKSGCA